MIRRLSIGITMLCFATGLAACARVTTPPAPVDTSADKAKLEADALVWFDHYAKADGDAMANLYAEDALLMPPGAPAVTGRAGIKTFLGEDSAKTKAAGISLKNASVTGSGVNGDVGWISGNYIVVDKSGATIDSGSYLSVHRRTNGSWPYIRDIWNSDRLPAAAAPPETGKKN
jgi:ketosteroid isomerase-like protein